jgi:hypothetical protein
VATRPTVDSSASPAALIDRIESLLAPGSRNEANATEALALTNRVLPTVTDSKTRAEVLFDRADALVVLDKHSEACGVLKSQEMQQAAANNRWADAVSNVIQEKCQ